MRLGTVCETMMKRTLLRIALVLAAACAAPQASGQTGATKDNPPSAPFEVIAPPPKPRPAPPQQLDLGTYEEGRYVNDFFGLAFSPPKDWRVVAAPTKAALREMTKTDIAPDDARAQAGLNASIERSTTLLTMTRYPAGMPANAAFLLIAERIPSPAVKTGADIIRSMEAGFKNTQFEVEMLQGGIRTERIGGEEFAVATLKFDSPRGVYMHKVYAAPRKGYALQFSLTYHADGEGNVAAFDEAVRSVVIK